MRKGLGVFLFAWVLSAGLCLSRAEVTGISVQAVEASIKEGNSRATLEKYFSCEKYAGSAYEGIASGAPEWIALAERIIQISDACYTEGIQAALGMAMQRAPRNVLPLVDKTHALAASYICLPFISSELPIEAQQAEVVRSRRAIQRVHDRDLAAQKTSCLRFIRSVEVGFVSGQTPTPKDAPK